jgi:hypothetical protein
VTSVLGIGVAPTIAASFSLGVTGAMNFDVAAFTMICLLFMFQTTLENSRVNLELQRLLFFKLGKFANTGAGI